jgi:hypothetical protein
MADLVQPEASNKNPQAPFYVDVLNPQQQIDYAKAALLKGLDEEIALLRTVIKTILNDDPENTRMLVAATNLLVKLVKTRYSIMPEEKPGLGEAIQNIFTDVGIPFGLSLLSNKLDGGK